MGKYGRNTTKKSFLFQSHRIPKEKRRRVQLLGDGSTAVCLQYCCLSTVLLFVYSTAVCLQYVMCVYSTCCVSTVLLCVYSTTVCLQYCCFSTVRAVCLQYCCVSTVLLFVYSTAVCLQYCCLSTVLLCVYSTAVCL
jgi:hypothetical protein